LTQESIIIEDWRIDTSSAIAVHPTRGTFQLKKKTLQVLIVLANAQGEVVTKSEIIAAVWPNIVVTENSLTQAISELRKVLGDSKSAPKYIQTFPNQGYQLCGSKKAESNLDKLRSNKIFVVSFILTFIAAVLFFWLYFNDNDKQLVSSPDGRFTAMIASEKSDYSVSIFADGSATAGDMFFRSLNIRSSDAFSWSIDSRYFVAIIPDSPEYFQFVISSLSSFEKFTVQLPKTLNEHTSKMLNDNVENIVALPFDVVEHKAVSKFLHVWELSNGQSIQIKFNQQGPQKVSWH